MDAAVGDRIRVRSAHLDQPERDGEVVEVHGEGGTPPWLVKWSADGHTSLFSPGPGVQVEHRG